MIKVRAHNPVGRVLRTFEQSSEETGRASYGPPYLLVKLPSLPRGQMSKTQWGSFGHLTQNTEKLQGSKPPALRIAGVAQCC